MYHIDLYRIHSEKDAIDIGLEEYLPSDGVTVIEWPERIASILPPQTQHWELEVVSLTERVIRQIGVPSKSQTTRLTAMLDLAIDTSASVGSIALGNARSSCRRSSSRARSATRPRSFPRSPGSAFRG